MDIKALRYQLTEALNDLEFIKGMHSCNDCSKEKECPNCPDPGQAIRINCFDWEGSK